MDCYDHVLAAWEFNLRAQIWSGESAQNQVLMSKPCLNTSDLQSVAELIDWDAKLDSQCDALSHNRSD